MPASVVHDLELIEIDEDNRMRHVVEGKSGELFGKPGFERAPVRKVGQGIVGCLPGEPLLLFLERVRRNLALHRQSYRVPYQKQDQYGCSESVNERQDDLDSPGAFSKNVRKGIRPIRELVVELVKSH